MPNTERIEKERSKAIDMAVGQIEKQFGKGAIMRLGGKGSISAIESIPTGSISIDYALGVGGVPRGRVVEIYGPEASGKTTLALQIIANAQATGGNAAFVDAEHALDPVYSTKLGVDLENLLDLAHQIFQIHRLDVDADIVLDVDLGVVEDVIDEVH